MFKHITEIDMKILSVFIQDYSARYTLREITEKKKINYANAHKRFKFLVENNFLKSKKSGSSHIISLNLNPNTISLISYVEAINKPEHLLFDNLIKKLVQMDSLACIGLFGSRINGKSKKNSDWDIFIITNNRREIEKELNTLSYNDFDFTVIEEKEFLDSLNSSEETVVKHIVLNKRIIYNPFPFYNLIYTWEMIKNVPR
jgi:predicted nucleotidyltransferase